jgi:alpha-ribazole phosphatase
MHVSNIRLYVVRHGATVWNKETRYQGQTDIPLNEEGERQAEKIAARFAGECIQAVYSSPLKRAFDTAKQIARPHSLDVCCLPGMLEIGFGDWEGKEYTHIRQQYSEELRRWIQNPLDNHVPNGEALPELHQRVEGALQEILSSHEEGNVVLVAHSGSIRMLFCCLLKMDLSAFWRIMQFNGAINQIEFRNGVPTVFTMNDTQHMIES